MAYIYGAFSGRGFTLGQKIPYRAKYHVLKFGPFWMSGNHFFEHVDLKEIFNRN